MNKFRYVLVAMIVVCSVFNSLFVGMAEEVATGIDYSVEVSTLKALEILKVDVGEEFKLDDNASRGQLATLLGIVMGVVKVEGVDVDRTLFNDVATDYPTAVYINTLAEMGIINGDGNGAFNPESPITFEQGIKTLVKALGYTAIAEQKGGYPIGYVSTAVQLKLTRNLDLQIGTQLTNGQVLRLIYNALEVDLMQQTSFGNTEGYETEKGKTLLTERLDIIKATGQVTANNDTSLTGESSIKDDEIIINGSRYTIGKTDAYSFLGYVVDYYYKKDAVTDEKVLLLMMQTKKNNVLKIKADDISEETTKAEFKYWIDKDNDEKAKSVKLSSDAKMIYNGKAYGSLSGSMIKDSDLIPSSGDIVLIDTDSNEVYDVILVTQYETYVLKNVANNTIYDRHSGKSKVLDIEDADATVSVTKAGLPVDVNSLEEWTIIDIAESKGTGKKLINAKISEEIVQGTIEQAEDDSITVDGKEYKIAKDYPMTNPIYAYKAGNVGTFYIDIDGKVASADLFSGSDNRYGYLLKFGTTSGLDAVGQFKILTTEGKWKIFKSKDKIKFNGVDNKPIRQVIDSIPYNIEGKTGEYKNKRQLIMYRLDDEGLLVELVTATDFVNSPTSTFEGYSVEQFSKDYASKGIVRIYINKINMNFDITTSLVFFAPTPDNKESILDDETVYGVGKLTSDEKKDVVIYDNSDVNKPAVILVYGTPTGSVGGGGAINYGDNVVILDKIVDAVDVKTGDSVKKAYYFKNGQYESASLEDADLKNNHPDVKLGSISVDSTILPQFTSKEKYKNTKLNDTIDVLAKIKLRDLGRGSALQIGMNARGEISDFYPFYNTNDIENPDLPDILSGLREAGDSLGIVYNKGFVDVNGRYIAYAKAVRKSGSTLVVNAQGTGDNAVYNKSYNLDGISIYIYDKATGKIKTGVANDIRIGEKVLIHVVYNTAKVLEIIR